MDRRSLLGFGLSGAMGLATGATGALGFTAYEQRVADGAVGSSTVPFYGHHQPGIDTPQPSHGALAAFTLHEDTDGTRLARLLRLWSNDAALLQSGQPALADSSPELSRIPASLTVTIGLGWQAFAAAGLQHRWPLSYAAIPDFATDRLEPRWSGGDLVLQVSGDDRTGVVHALRELTKDALPFAEPRWRQSGWHVQPHVSPDVSPRNLLGFREGAGNPVPSTRAFGRTVWNTGTDQAWFAGGTSLVVRRIRVDLDRWEEVPPVMQEQVFGRHVITGAPLGGTSEYQRPDFNARSASGGLAIPEDAHIRRAESHRNIYRRPWNYDDGLDAQGRPDAGLIFIAFGSNVDRYIGIQAALATRDALNRWTAAVGSALFVVPPGASADGGWVGESLFGS